MQPQRSNEWYVARLGRATASRFGDIMAGAKYAGWRNYRADLVIERLTGTRIETYTSTAMQWGIDTEPLARLRYSLTTKQTIEECGLFAHEKLEAGASPDGLIGTDGVVEIKCPNPATHIETLKTNKVPKAYYWQMMGQLWITGRDWADYVSFDPRLPDNASLIIIRVYRNEEEIKKLEEQVKVFLDEVEEELKFIKFYSPKEVK